MDKPRGFFTDEKLATNRDRVIEIRKLDEAASQRRQKERERLNQTMVTRQGLFGSETKSAWEWKPGRLRHTGKDAITGESSFLDALNRS